MLTRASRIVGKKQCTRAFATVEKSSTGAIGSDGRHEIWRGDVDHDNEPKVSGRILLGASGSKAEYEGRKSP